MPYDTSRRSTKLWLHQLVSSHQNASSAHYFTLLLYFKERQSSVKIVAIYYCIFVLQTAPGKQYYGWTDLQDFTSTALCQ